MSPRNSADSTQQPQSPDTPSSSVRFSNPDIFSDDFALEPLDVADGFNPTREAPNVQAEEVPLDSSGPHRSVSLRSSNIPESNPRINKNVRNSISKPRFHLTTRHPSRSSSSNVPGSSFSHNRSSTASSTFAFPQRQSVYQGATGPSHPYGMYPQGTQEPGLNRSNSLATTASSAGIGVGIGAIDHPYDGPSAPVHPYGMYPQNTIPDVEVPTAVVPTAVNPAQQIPIGFNGQGDHYQRRLGPDREDVDDMIGPDGHTEQLPPYTRWPNDHPPNPAAIVTEASPLSLDPAGPSSGQSSIRTMQQQNLGPPPTRMSSRTTSSAASGDSHIAINTAAAETAGINEKPADWKERWKKRAHKKVCGVPMWLLALVCSLLVGGAFVGGILAGAVLRPHPNKSSNKSGHNQPPAAATTGASTVVVTTTTILDASPIPSTYTSVSAAPTGTYVFAVSSPTLSADACLTDSSQKQAWGCADDGYLGLNIYTAGTATSPQISMGPTSTSSPKMVYGPQYPALKQPYTLVNMVDLEDLGLGPTKYFQEKYDKIMILQSSAFSSDSKRSVNLADAFDRQLWTRDDAVKPGDTPWFCVWNDTVIEGFIYVDQNRSTATSTSSAASSTSSSSSSKRDDDDDSFPGEYPRIMKIEERRIAQRSVDPYCQQMKINSDYSYCPVKDSSNNNVIIELSETESLSQDRLFPPATSAPGSRRRKRRIKRSLTDGCICQWMSS
ncbi:MAG: hypothetical protein M1834_000617 [Cirrosporium novae-zelandiae]|nr:MAG: hypothetical protein M1834_000617 [Cirrosporium novae-zelandiae]